MRSRWLDQHPVVKIGIKTVLAPFRRGVSSNYVPVPPHDAKATALRLRDAWRGDELPSRQRLLVDGQILRYRRGEANAAFDALVECLASLPLSAANLLEIGCSSGYYSEVLAARRVPLLYRGCDYSAAFIGLARQRYPELPFDVADATRLPYAANAFDVVVSGCCLLHIPEYAEAVRETARVTGRYAVFHRTPVLGFSPSRYFVKQAYGVKTIEIHFNEGELVRLFAAHGLNVIDVRPIAVEWRKGDVFSSKTYLCQKDALRAPNRMDGHGRNPGSAESRRDKGCGN